MDLRTAVKIVALSKVFKKRLEEIGEYLSFGGDFSTEVAFSSSEFKTFCSNLLDYLNNKGVRLITYWDEEYPQILREIQAPPVFLFAKGNPEFLNYNLFGVVGTRKMTNYGRQITERFVVEISKHFVIVSGMAYGVDTIAHITALKSNRPTIAVLGCGVDVVYPKSNKALYEEIIKSGCIVSEYLPWQQPQKYTFVERNRIISGLSKGILVTEASIESGALITAKFALEQGRDIFAVPGDIIKPSSRGTNYLIKNGAFLVTEPSDVLEYYGFKEHKALAELSEEEIVIMKFIDEETSIEELSDKSRLPFSQILLILTTLELKGFVYKTESGLYARSIDL